MHFFALNRVVDEIEFANFTRDTILIAHEEYFPLWVFILDMQNKHT